MKRVYLSGKMSGLPNFGVEIFAEAAAQLREAGYTVFSPAELAVQSEDKPWTDYMKADLVVMLQHCDGVVALPNWRTSRGARMEIFVAYAMGLPVIDLVMALNPKNPYGCNPVDPAHFDFLCKLVMTDPESLGKQPEQPIEVEPNENQECLPGFCAHSVVTPCRPAGS